jgi:hypothetical protein
LQHHCDAFERETPFGCPGLRLKLKIHGGLPSSQATDDVRQLHIGDARTAITVAASTRRSSTQGKKVRTMRHLPRARHECT